MPCTIPPRDKAISAAQNLSGPAIFTDSSVQNGVVGIGIHSPNISHFPISSATIAPINMLNVIDVALTQLIHPSNTDPPGIQKSVTIFTDSQAALNALNYLASHSGQFLV